MSTKSKLQDNINALEVILTNTTGTYSAKEIEVVKKYNGWGNHKAILFGDGPIETWEGASAADKALYPEYQKLYTLMKDELSGRQYRVAIDSLKNSILTQYLTPKVIPATFYDVLSHYISVESMLDPSAGMGIFITEAIGKLSLNSGVTAYEKDTMTAHMLKVIMDKEYKVEVLNKPFEESSSDADDVYDLVATNPPYGAISVFDPLCKDKNVYSKIHCYFVWKSLQKCREGGIVALLITNAFLDTVSNKSVREWLFMHSDFISLTVMPDNLMKESGGTEAPSHFLVVRKNSSKTEMSDEEKLLCVSEMTPWPSGPDTHIMVAMNKYIQNTTEDIVIGARKTGKNQYGKPAMEVWWSDNIEDIAKPFKEILSRDMEKRYIKKDYNGRGIEIPVGKIEILGPGKWKWKEEDEMLNVCNTDSCPELCIPPWEDDESSTCVGCGIGMFGSKPFCDQCTAEGRTLPETFDEEYEQRPKEHSKAQEEDDTDQYIAEPSDVGEYQDPLYAKWIKEQALDIATEASGLSDMFKPMSEWEQEYQNDVTTDEKLLENVEEVKTVSKRDKAVMEKYIEIKECYIALTEVESNE